MRVWGVYGACSQEFSAKLGRWKSDGQVQIQCGKDVRVHEIERIMHSNGKSLTRLIKGEERRRASELGTEEETLLWK